MPTKQGSSPKTDRANARIKQGGKKGFVRQHERKPVSLLSDTGLLNELSHRAHQRQLRSTDTTDVNLAKARQYLCDEVGKRAADIFKNEAWPKATRVLVCQYIKSLALGDGSKPAELAPVCAQRIEAIFAERCSEIIVGDDTLPAQRQDWYQPMLQAYRKARSKQQKAKRPTPQDIPRKRALQPTG